MAFNDQALNQSENSQSIIDRIISFRLSASTLLGYDEVGVSRLTNEFERSLKLRAMLAEILKPLNDVDRTANDLKYNRWIETAVGQQLDGAGYIVGESRMERDDETYRNAIKFRIFVNTSTATPQDLIRATKFLTAPDDVQYLESYPATAILFTSGATIPDGIQSVIQNLSPAAISNVPVLVTYAHAKPFRLGKQSPPAELFVNNDKDYLQVNDSDLQIATTSQTGTSRLGGLVASDLDVADGFLLDVGIGTLAINSSNFDTVLESGYHLTGCFQ